jgi:molybdate transport system substrate-binding protein
MLRPWLWAMCALWLCAGALRADAETRIAAASDLQFVLPQLAEAFRHETGEDVTVIFGASGNLTRQIRQGAPFDVFMSADSAYVAELRRLGLTQGAGAVYAIGRLALVVPKTSGLSLDAGLASLKAAIDRGAIARFAIANPEHAPYGARARQALVAAGQWPHIEPRVVLGENVAQATQYVLSGNADAGLIAHAMTFGPSVRDRLRVTLVSDSLHAPLIQEMTLLPGADPGAVRFFAFMRTEKARSILALNGFTPPTGRQ